MPDPINCPCSPPIFVDLEIEPNPSTEPYVENMPALLEPDLEGGGCDGTEGGINSLDHGVFYFPDAEEPSCESPAGVDNAEASIQLCDC